MTQITLLSLQEEVTRRAICTRGEEEETKGKYECITATPDHMYKYDDTEMAVPRRLVYLVVQSIIRETTEKKKSERKATAAK